MQLVVFETYASGESVNELMFLIYGVSCAMLILIGFHRIWLLVDFLNIQRAQKDAAKRHIILDRHPLVTVQLPLYNERAVAKRLIDAACQIDYPRERLEIQILDDSTDDTREIVAKNVACWRQKGVRVRHIRRELREGYKAGALAHGLEVAEGELIAIFDADFLPQPNFLMETVPYFDRPEIGMVQTRWAHLNKESNWLTRAQSIFLDEHFTIEHQVRHFRRRFFNFNGTAGVWRRSAIEKAGGWDASTLTEDLDLSFRAQLSDIRFEYLDDVTVGAELPSDLAAFKSQQHRWAKGSAQTARKLLKPLWSSTNPFAVRLDATAKLLQNVAFVFLFGIVLTMPFVALNQPAASSLMVKGFILGTLFGGMMPIAVSFFIAQQLRGETWIRSLCRIPVALATGAALSINNGRAVVEGLFGFGIREFVRTPKQGDQKQKPYRTPVHVSVYLEMALGVLHLSVAVLLTLDRQFWLTPFLYAFGLALCCVSFGAIFARYQPIFRTASGTLREVPKWT